MKIDIWPRSGENHQWLLCYPMTLSCPKTLLLLLIMIMITMVKLFELLLCAKYWTIRIIFYLSLIQASEVGIFITSVLILWMRKSILRKVSSSPKVIQPVSGRVRIQTQVTSFMIIYIYYFLFIIKKKLNFYYFYSTVIHLWHSPPKLENTDFKKEKKLRITYNFPEKDNHY